MDFGTVGRYCQKPRRTTTEWRRCLPHLPELSRSRQKDFFDLIVCNLLINNIFRIKRKPGFFKPGFQCSVFFLQIPYKLLKVVDVFYKCLSIKEGLCFGKSNIRFDTIINIIERAIFNGCQLFWSGNLENGSGSGRAGQYNTGSSTRTLSHQCHLTGCFEGCRYQVAA